MPRPVLISVDDNPADQRLLETACREIGWDVEVIGLEDGASALRELAARADRGGPPPTLVLDLNMPGVDGWGVLDALAQRPGLVAEIMVFTSSREIADLKRATRLGAARYLIKPLEYEGWLSLAATLRQHLAESAS